MQARIVNCVHGPEHMAWLPGITSSFPQVIITIHAARDPEALLGGGTQTFAFAMLMFAVAAAGTIMIGIMPRTSFLSLPFCELGPCRELLCGGLQIT